MSEFRADLVSPLAKEIIEPANVFFEKLERSDEYTAYRFSNHTDFSVDIEAGYDPGDPCVPEPETLYIEYLTSKIEHRGIATAAVSNVLVQAKEQGFEYARMTIVNPTVIRIVQTLLKLGYAQSAGYSINFYDEPYGQAQASQLIASSKDIPAELASEYLDNVIAIANAETELMGAPQDRQAHIQCVIKL